MAPSRLIKSASAGRHTKFTVCPASASFVPKSEPYEAPKMRMLYVVDMKYFLLQSGSNKGRSSIPAYGMHSRYPRQVRDAMPYAAAVQSKIRGPQKIRG
jgi:hypothetical protein